MALPRDFIPMGFDYKGIDVVSTGDFTHPAWLKELEEKLQPEGNAFYTLKHLPAMDVLPEVKVPQRKISFCLSAEVSCEYSEGGKLYKNLQRYDRKLSIAVSRLRSDTKNFTARYDGLHGRVYFFEKVELCAPKLRQATLF